jgi:hypothetical protein
MTQHHLPPLNKQAFGRINLHFIRINTHHFPSKALDQKKGNRIHSSSVNVSKRVLCTLHRQIAVLVSATLHSLTARVLGARYICCCFADLI